MMLRTCSKVSAWRIRSRRTYGVRQGTQKSPGRETQLLPNCQPPMAGPRTGVPRGTLPPKPPVPSGKRERKGPRTAQGSSSATGGADGTDLCATKPVLRASSDQPRYTQKSFGFWSNNSGEQSMPALGGGGTLPKLTDCPHKTQGKSLKATPALGEGPAIPAGPGTAARSPSAPVRWSPAQPAAAVPWPSALRGGLRAGPVGTGC